MKLATLIYRSEFSVLFPAAHTYLTAIVATLQTLVTDIAETTAQAGYDRADWFYQTWATAHYSDMPQTQPVDEMEPDYWLEPLEIVTLQLEPLHRFITAPYTFIPFGLLAPGAEVNHFPTMNIRELRAIAKQRGIKKYGSMPKARLVEVLTA